MPSHVPAATPAAAAPAPAPTAAAAPLSMAAACLGGAAGLLLTASAWLSGALPAGDPGPRLFTEGLGTVPASFRLGLLCWLVGTTGWCAVWWRYLATIRVVPVRPDQRGPAPARVLLLGAVWTAPLLFAPPLGSRDIYAYACQGWLWHAGVDPYTFGVADGGCPWSQAVPALWWSTPTPYGPLAVGLAGAAAALGGLLASLAGLRLIALLGLALLAVAMPRLARACGVAPAAAYGLGLVTPLVAVHALSAAHNDALLAGLMTAALALALPPAHPLPDTHGRLPADRARVSGTARGPGALGVALAAGALSGAAVGVKVTAVVVLPFLLLLLGRRWWAGLIGTVVSFGGLSLATGLGLGWVTALRGTGELAQWSSVPTAVGMSAGYLLRAAGRPDWYGAAVATGRACGLVALAAVGVLACRAAWRGRATPRVVLVAAGWLSAATALLGPVFYPWYALAPLALLAATETDERRRRWLAVGTMFCAFLTLPNGLGVPVLTKAVGAFAVTAALIVALVRRTRTIGTT